MKQVFLSFPRLNLSLKAPQEALDILHFFYPFSIHLSKKNPIHSHFILRKGEDSWELLEEDEIKCHASQLLSVILSLESEIEESFIRHRGNWVAFHAGAVAMGKEACLFTGDPDSGKSTSTVQMVELGHAFLSEEVTLVDPGTLSVYPYLQTISLEKSYLDSLRRVFPIKKGDLYPIPPDYFRYTPYRVRQTPARLKQILFPRYDPNGEPGLIRLSPGEALPEILGYCFPPPPNVDDEILFDSVIHILNKSPVYRITYRDVKDARERFFRLPILQ